VEFSRIDERDFGLVELEITIACSLGVRGDSVRDEAFSPMRCRVTMSVTMN
jgi:hypothetical protein